MASLAVLEHRSQAPNVPGPPAETPHAQTNAPQAIRLDLTRDILDDILRTARAGGKVLQVKFGKDPVRGISPLHCESYSLTALFFLAKIDSKLWE